MIIILSSLTAPRSSSVGPSVPVSPIFVLRTVVLLRLRTSATLPPGFCCVQMRSCALSFKCGCAVKEKFPIFSGGAGSAGLRAGAALRKVQLFFTAATVNTHTEGEEKKNKRRRRSGAAASDAFSDGSGRERSASVCPTKFSHSAAATGHGVVGGMVVVQRCSWKWVGV